MIESIGIRNLGVIESANLELGAGFTALTGETGAGKTMVLNALALLLGGRADSSAVRSGQTQLFVEGSWLLSDDELLERVSQLGGVVEDQRLIINRSVTSDGRSKAVVGGAQTPASSLSEISQQLVTVHGQSDQLRLRSIAAQREALDVFGGPKIAQAFDTYRSVYSAYQDLSARLERLQSASASDQRRVAELRELLTGFESLAPEVNELGDIADRLNRLVNVEALRISAATAHQHISEQEPSALELTGSALRSLQSSTDPELLRIAEQLRFASSQLSDASAELATYLLDLEADPALLESLQDRKAQLVQFERKAGMSMEELFVRLPSLQNELLDLDGSDEQIEKLEAQLAATESQLGLAANALTQARKEASERLIQFVGVELNQLAMTSTRFSIHFSQLNEFEASGVDRVEFMLANAGSEPRPLAKGASGGELSRVMLAIELVLIADRPLPTMVFDEVDAGVGGQAAVELGRRLRKLSEKTQVLVVTHLPQVAAFANHQVRVSKSVSGEITTSSVQLLNDNERRRELARMLSGNPDSEVALKHAAELLNSVA